MPKEYEENCGALALHTPNDVHGTHVVDEPDERNDEQSPPVELDDKQIRDSDILHGLPECL